MLELFCIFKASVVKEYFMIETFAVTALETLQLPTQSTIFTSKMYFYMPEAGICIFLMLIEQLSHFYRYIKYPYNLGSQAIQIASHLNAEPEATSGDRSYSVQYHFTCQRGFVLHTNNEPSRVLHPQATEIVISLRVLVDKAT